MKAENILFEETRKS